MDETLELEQDNMNHIIPIEVVVEFVENCPKEIINKINKNLSIVDFKNGDVLHFIKHIAKGMVQI